MPQPPLAPKTSNSHSRPWLQSRSGPQPPLAPYNPPLAATISPLALAAIGRMALAVNLSSTSADVVVQPDTSAIWPMAASARGEMVGARGELLGARLLEVFGARGGCSTYGPYLCFNFRL